MHGAGERDATIRLAAFRWLQDQVELHGEVLPWSVLQSGLPFEGGRVRLMGPQGIFKPAQMPELPLTITTAPERPYDDAFTGEGFLGYRYRGQDPGHPDNRRLRRTMELQVPLIYLHGVSKGKYLAVWPVFVVGDDPDRLTFTVAADEVGLAEGSLRDGARRARSGESLLSDSETSGRRAYITASVRVRLHQRGFREKVLRAYQEQCAMCRLRQRELLDAAHIIADKDVTGDAVVANGLALCKIHHAAFDRMIVGIRPDYVIQVQQRVLEQEDGPMLRHGLQDLHDTKLYLPRSKGSHPDPGRLEERYARFVSVA